MGQEDREGCGSPAVNTGLHGSVVEGHWAQVAASSHALPKGLERSRGAAASFPHTGQVGAWGSRGQHPVGQGAASRPPSVFILQRGFPDGEASVAMSHTGKPGRSETPVTARWSTGPAA